MSRTWDTGIHGSTSGCGMLPNSDLVEADSGVVDPADQEHHYGRWLQQD